MVSCLTGNHKVGGSILCYVSVNSNWVHLPPGQLPGKLFEQANPGNPGNFFVKFPAPGAKMMVELPGLWQNFPKLEETAP